jgi:GT2 family glycosyltransferase
MIRICVIIVNYHSAKLVNACLDSLRALNREDLKYVVVDNSTIGEMQQIQSRQPEVLILNPGQNLGFAGGCNIGIRYALEEKIPYILLLNPDTRVENDSLSSLTKIFETDSEIGMAGPIVFEDKATRPIWPNAGDFNWWIAGLRRRRWSNGDQTKGEIAYVSFLSGCAMMLRTEAVEDVGLMDERYFLYFEDADYCQAFIRKGWKIVLVQTARILHAPSSTIGQHSANQVYFLSRNRMWLTRRWATRYEFSVFMLFNSLIKIPGVFLMFGLKWRRPDLIKAYLRGYWDGLCLFR